MRSQPRLLGIGLALLLAPAPCAATDPVAEASPPDLASLLARLPSGPTEPAVAEKFETDVFRLIESGALQTAGDFRHAASLCTWGQDNFRVARSRYELLLAAVALEPNHPDPALREAWDNFQLALAQPARFPATGYLAQNSDSVPKLLAPEVIQRVWGDPSAARSATSDGDNPELKKLFDEDQAVRQTDWSRLSQAERQSIHTADLKRNARTREIVAGGGLSTGQDFVHAALLCQHSPDFAGYRLAHELAVAGLLLRAPQARWLAAATYDRMLNATGHSQRFGTQYGSTLKLLRLDESAFSDRQRLALGCPVLEVARNRKW
ncbi:MAG: hypothetical protein C0502_09675 [Opitutus sp.]|nr:hypothetical protein [Opitutus sp.]